MRIASKLLGIAACCLALEAHANVAITPKTPPAPGVVLDHSQNVFFDEFSPNTFSLQLLQAKNSYVNGDLVFGGSLELDLQTWHGNDIPSTPNNIYSHGGGLYITQGTVDVMGNICNGLTSFISIADSNAGIGGEDGNYYYLPEAFLLFGNLQAFPVYLTLGINGIPFGVFTGSGPWDTPLTADYFYPSQAPQISAGYSHNGWNVVATEFRDETNYDYHTVSNIYYNKSIGEFSFTIGGGSLTNLKTNAAGSPATSSNRKSNLPDNNMGRILDLNANVQYREVSMAFEFAEGSSKVALNDDKPRAYSLEAIYTPSIAGEDTTFGLSYSASLDLDNIPTSLSGFDAIPSALPGLKNEWALGVSRQVVIPNVVLGLELERATTYVEQNTYTGTVDLVVYL